MFTDVQFMTAKEKDLVLKSWKTFLKHGPKKQHFTKRLYEHMCLHCGFIAHRDIKGFYSTYFKSGQDTDWFFKRFKMDRRIFRGDYEDVNKAMLKVYYQYKHRINAQINNDIAEKLNMLEEGVLEAKQNPRFARDFLSRLNLER